MKTIKINIHSVVDVITNSSTTIFTYQNSIEQAKELIQEMLNLCGIKDKTPDDLFYYGVFCDDDCYLEYINDRDDDDDDIEDVVTVDAKYDTPEYEEQTKKQEKWLENLLISIAKEEIEEPDWMDSASTSCSDSEKDTYLNLIPKDDKYKNFADKIQKLLGSVSADGGRDG